MLRFISNASHPLKEEFDDVRFISNAPHPPKEEVLKLLTKSSKSKWRENVNHEWTEYNSSPFE